MEKFVYSAKVTIFFILSKKIVIYIVLGSTIRIKLVENVRNVIVLVYSALLEIVNLV